MIEESSSIILITNTLSRSPKGGRELLCKLTHDALKHLYGDRLIVIELTKVKIRSVTQFINVFIGHIDGVDRASIRLVEKKIQANFVSKIFVDGSNLGGIVKEIKQNFPDIEVSTFFHNVEARFFAGAFRQNMSFRALTVLIANYLAERKSVRYSDKIICLSKRDSQLLHKLYGRCATHISSMALQDGLHAIPSSLEISGEKERFALFVGGTFYANYAGITWYVKNVVPHIQIKTYIVGKGFEKYRRELEIDEKVVVVGGVESLAKWYRDAYFVIAPIFDGSGMKTKVAEALMYGKKVIGTPESFSGYEDIIDEAGLICSSVEEFVSAIEGADEMVKSSFDLELRKIYEEAYSLEAVKLRLKSILDSSVGCRNE